MLKKTHQNVLKDIVENYDWDKHHCHVEKFGCSVQEIKGDLVNYVVDCTCTCDLCTSTVDVKDMLKFMEDQKKVAQYQFNAMYTIYTQLVVGWQQQVQQCEDKMKEYDSCDCCPNLSYKHGSEDNQVMYINCKCKYNNTVTETTRCRDCRLRYMSFICGECECAYCYCMVSAVGFGYLSKHKRCLKCVSNQPSSFF